MTDPEPSARCARKPCQGCGQMLRYGEAAVKVSVGLMGRAIKHDRIERGETVWYHVNCPIAIPAFVPPPRSEP